MTQKELDQVTIQVAGVLNGRYVRTDLCREREEHMHEKLDSVETSVKRVDEKTEKFDGRLWGVVVLGVVQLAGLAATLLTIILRKAGS